MNSTPFLRETYTDIYKFLGPKDIMNFRSTSRIGRIASPSLEEIRRRRQQEIVIDRLYQKWITNLLDIDNLYWYFYDYIVAKYGAFKRIDITREFNYVTFCDYMNIYLSFLKLMKNTLMSTSHQMRSYVNNYLLSSRDIYNKYLIDPTSVNLNNIPKENNPLENYFKNPPKQYKYTAILLPIIQSFNSVINHFAHNEELIVDTLNDLTTIENYLKIPHYGNPKERLDRICITISNSLNN